MGNFCLNNEWEIKGFKVQNLFGDKNYTIFLNKNPPVTILYGLNGTGKTTILNCINNILTSNFQALQNVPFEIFRLILNNEIKIDFANISQLENEPRKLRISCSEFLDVFDPTDFSNKGHYSKDNEDIEYFYRRFNSENLKKLSLIITQYVDLNRKFKNHKQIYEFLLYLRKNNKEFQNLTQDIAPSVLLKLIEILMNKSTKIPFWFKKLIEFNPPWFIPSERLFIDIEVHEMSERTMKLERVINQNSKELFEMKRRAIENSTEIARSQNVTFPNRIIKALKTEEVPSEFDLQIELNKVREKENNLIITGLGTKEQAKIPEVASYDLRDANIAQAISLWLKDLENIQGSFDTLLDSMHTFEEIINKRLFDKRIEFGGNFGFRFKTSRGIYLEGDQLSSGEQHLVVLIFNMIFKIPNNALVLIDEPEISLHTFWQNSFIDDITKIGENKRFIIATHSESIIFGRINLLRHLGQEELPINEYRPK